MRRLSVACVLSLAGLVAFPAFTACSQGTETLPYDAEEVSAPGAETGTTLAGTLTWPKVGCPCPTAILVQGAGSHDRDYTVFGHKPFEVIADHLGRNGIATLRFDERGVGESGGAAGGVSAVDLAADVMAWIDLLHEHPMVDSQRVGIVGHSEGGIIGTLVAARTDLGFLIMLGSPGLPGVEYNLQYEESMGRAMGLPEETIRSRGALQARILDVVLNEGDRGKAEERLRAIYQELSPPIPEAALERGVARLLSPGFRFNLSYDPAATLNQVDAPVLAVFAERDVHVPPERNREAMVAALDTGSGRNRVVVLPGLNHFMQTAATGSPDEYADIPETMAQVALDLILEWILTHTR